MLGKSDTGVGDRAILVELRPHRKKNHRNFGGCDFYMKDL
jgi:hypothetical protein